MDKISLRLVGTVFLFFRTTSWSSEKIWFQTLLWYWEERTGLKIKMSTLYSIVGISKQAFHQRLNRHLGMQEELGYLLQIVREIRDDHPKMSVRKIYRMIRPKAIGRDRFEAFCFDSGLAVVVPKNYRRTTNSLGVTRFPNLVIGLKISRLHQVWVSDITYFELAGQWCCLTFIIDIYARTIIGFTASKELCAEQTSISAFKMAIRFRKFLNHKITGVIFHSDGGGQYHSKKFLELTN